MTKLEEMRKRLAKLDVPKPPCLPQGKKVFLFRLPPEEKLGSGILYAAEAHADPDKYAVLIAAGLKARDVMRDHLMEIGDIVLLPAFVTDTPEIENKEGRGVHIVRLNIEDLNGSVDGWERFENEYRVAYDEENGEHFYEKRDADHTRARRKKAA